MQGTSIFPSAHKLLWQAIDERSTVGKLWEEEREKVVKTDH